ncbi:hypothetical protein CCHR01_04881 [Colletotrichum chrysophilum]|uniref:Uncharacterized protein n=1 Tax=Colletotrichum chrysophilum TaxID=1836956 RepID=A0AAD9EPZ4_9PEZI|nr:hypothetical protein CCHR01_04881 [Colletotrichum chrysophilum]
MKQEKRNAIKKTEGDESGSEASTKVETTQTGSRKLMLPCLVCQDLSAMTDAGSKRLSRYLLCGVPVVSSPLTRPEIHTLRPDGPGFMLDGMCGVPR